MTKTGVQADRGVHCRTDGDVGVHGHTDGDVGVHGHTDGDVEYMATLMGTSTPLEMRQMEVYLAPVPTNVTLY